MSPCLESPTPGEAASRASNALSRGMVVVLAGRCWVEYEGRGVSRSTPGDRLVIVKPGGSVIVHGHKGFKPENWQPEGSVVYVEERGGTLVIRAVRRRPREVLVVTCDAIHGLMSYVPRETGSFTMYMSESEIRDAIARNPWIIGEGYRAVEREKPVESGFVDLFMADPEGRLVVVEIKRVKAGESAVRQLSQYLEALAKRGIVARGVLAAPGFTDAATREARARGIDLVYLDLKRLWELARRKPKPRSLDEFFQPPREHG